MSKLIGIGDDNTLPPRVLSTIAESEELSTAIADAVAAAPTGASFLAAPRSEARTVEDASVLADPIVADPKVLDAMFAAGWVPNIDAMPGVIAHWKGTPSGSSWVDSVGGAAFVQATAGLQPSVSTINGRPALLADGTDDVMTLDSAGRTLLGGKRVGMVAVGQLMAYPASATTSSRALVTLMNTQPGSTARNSGLTFTGARSVDAPGYKANDTFFRSSFPIDLNPHVFTSFWDSQGRVGIRVDSEAGAILLGADAAVLSTLTEGKLFGSTDCAMKAGQILAFNADVLSPANLLIIERYYRYLWTISGQPGQSTIEVVQKAGQERFTLGRQASIHVQPEGDIWVGWSEMVGIFSDTAPGSRCRIRRKTATGWDDPITITYEDLHNNHLTGLGTDGAGGTLVWLAIRDGGNTVENRLVRIRAGESQPEYVGTFIFPVEADQITNIVEIPGIGLCAWWHETNSRKYGYLAADPDDLTQWTQHTVGDGSFETHIVEWSVCVLPDGKAIALGRDGSDPTNRVFQHTWNGTAWSTRAQTALAPESSPVHVIFDGTNLRAYMLNRVSGTLREYRKTYAAAVADPTSAWTLNRTLRTLTVPGASRNLNGYPRVDIDGTNLRITYHWNARVVLETVGLS
jgi:hypothetical protein